MLVLSIAELAAGCGGDHSGGPQGTPDFVVGHAPQRTMDARTARVVLAGTDARATGVVDFTAGVSRLDLSDGTTVVLTADLVYLRAKGQDKWRPVTIDQLPATLRPADPVAAVALVAGSTTERSDGGAEVRGASTLAYTIEVDALSAISALPAGRQPALRRTVGTADQGTLHLQVAVDSQGRLRRVLLPVPLRPGPPTTRLDGEPVAVTVDIFDFGLAPPVTVPAAADVLPQ